MNKKLLAILTLLILVTCITAVSAFDLGGIFGDDKKNETVTLDGIKFNIPSDYKEATSNQTKSVAAKYEQLGANVTAKFYTNEKEGIGFFVCNFTGKGGVPAEFSHPSTGNETTIKNITGFMDHSDKEATLFSFTKNDTLVLVSSTNDKLFEQVLI